MSVDCVEATGDSFDIFDDQDEHCKVSTWNGREVTVLDPEKIAIAKVIAILQALHTEKNLSNVFHYVEQLNIDQTEQSEFELARCYGFGKPELDNFKQSRSFIIPCKSWLRRRCENVEKIWHKIKKGGEKVGHTAKKMVKHIAHRTKKVTEEVVDYVKDHKKEALIAVAVVAAISGAFIVAGALGGAAAAAPKKKEDENDNKATTVPSDPPPLPDWAQDLVKSTSADLLTTDAGSLENAKKEAHEAWDLFNHLKTSTENNLADLKEVDREFNPSAHAVETFLNAVEPNSQKQEVYKNFISSQGWGETVQLGHQKIDEAFSALSAHNKAVETSKLLDKLTLGLEIISRGMLDPKLLDPNTSVDAFKPNVPLEHPKQTIRDYLTHITTAFAAQPLLIASQQLAPINVPKVDAAPTADLKSRYFKTAGIIPDGMLITFINGMGNEFEASYSNTEHIRSSHPDHPRIDGIYNHTNGVPADLLEIYSCNYNGHSPRTQELLIQKWTTFHEQNKDRSDAKILHFCHSQGAIHTKNALMRLPREIQERVIVVAIAPAAVVSEGICHDSFNYASKKDIVPFGEVIATHLRACSLEGNERIDFLVNSSNVHKELIWLEPHEGAGLFDIDHGFQSPTYSNPIRDHLEAYYDYCNSRKTQE